MPIVLSNFMTKTLKWLNEICNDSLCKKDYTFILFDRGYGLSIILNLNKKFSQSEQQQNITSEHASHTFLPS